jgi:hypothetical protein
MYYGIEGFLVGVEHWTRLLYVWEQLSQLVGGVGASDVVDGRGVLVSRVAVAVLDGGGLQASPQLGLGVLLALLLVDAGPLHPRVVVPQPAEVHPLQSSQLARPGGPFMVLCWAVVRRMVMVLAHCCLSV